MLRGLRKASSGFIGKVIMASVVGFLVISFVIWGIGDIFRGGGRQTVATVGSTEISGDQFRQTFNDRLQQLSRQVGRPVTPAQAQAFGFDQQLLGQLVAEAALDEQTRKMKLGVSNADISKRIMLDPSFVGLSGAFDQQRFEQAIRQAGYTEQRYVAEQRKVSLRRQLAGAITTGAAIPAAEIETVNRFQNETRDVDYVTITRASAGEIAAPSPEALEKYYTDRKVTFRAPEYRKLTVLMLSADAIAKAMQISDDDAKALYEARKVQYSTPEKRDIQQIVFPNEEDAKVAAAKVAAGNWFELVAGERGLKPTDINLGTIAKSAIADKAIADAAFELKAGDVSAPITGRFGVVLLRVNKIEPAHTSTYEEVAADLKTNLANDRAKQEVATKRDKIEDELAAGSRLSEVSQKIGVPAVTIDAIDRSGRGPDGNPANMPAGVDVLTQAFSTDVGVENDPVQITGGYAWYEVAGITPPRDRTLEEVRARVEQGWRDEEIATRLKTKATEMVEKLKGGETFAALAEADKLKVESAKALKRNSADPLPQFAVGEIFKLAKDTAGSSEAKDPIERVVFRVTAISVPAFDAASPEAKQMSDTLKNAIADELLTQYIARVETDLGTTINRAALTQALSASGGGGNTGN
jgi:peptidyl-prolyl cis-trans isomerase D